MKSKLRAFYTTPSIEIDDENTIFITDSNVLISLYLFENDSFDSISKIMKEQKNKFWIPFHVALEYQRNRINQIKLDHQVRGAIESYFDKSYRNMDDLISVIERKKSKKYKGIIDGLKGILEESKERKSAFLNEQSTLLLSPTKDDYFNDKVRCVIDEVFEGRVGEPYDQERLSIIYSEGAKRYEKQIPPGFKDDNKEEQAFYYNGVEYKNRYGDLIIWNQTLDFIRGIDGNKTIVFVTNDMKDDWWLKLNDVKIPHFYLKGEVFSTNPNVNFELISADDFFRILVKSTSEGKNVPDDLYSDISRVSEMSSSVDDDKSNSLECDSLHTSYSNGVREYEYLKMFNKGYLGLFDKFSKEEIFKAKELINKEQFKSLSDIKSEIEYINNILESRRESGRAISVQRVVELMKRKRRLNNLLQRLTFDENESDIDDLLS